MLVRTGHLRGGGKKGRKELGFYVAFNSLGHIAMREKPGTGKKFPNLHE